MKIISFSVWGTNHKFIDGAIDNIKLAALYYPGWICRIYCDANLNPEWIQELRCNRFEIRRRLSLSEHDGLFWRFEPAYEPGVDAFISRDCDSRLNPREAAAVSEWLISGKLLHTMRDHYQHIVPILGGMWGCRFWPDFYNLISKWPGTGKFGDDQEFLKQIVWPLVKNDKCIQHDRYVIDTTIETTNGSFTYKPVEFFGGNSLCAFPPHEPLNPKIHGYFVGDRFGL